MLKKKNLVSRIIGPTVPIAFRIPKSLRQDNFLLDGRIERWTGAMAEVYSPLLSPAISSKRPLGSYPLFDEQQTLLALDASLRAYNGGRGDWPTMTVKDRIRHVEHFNCLFREKRQEVVTLLMWEIGKSLAEAEAEFDRTAQYISDTVQALKDLDHASSRLVVSGGVIAQVKRSPLGVVLCLGPSNYPLNETFTVLIPALIMGNVALVKPPKVGILLHGCLLEALKDSFPPGVVNTVHGDGAQVVTPLIKSGKIDVLAFIGSSRVANLIRQQHPRPNRLRCILGLEAKNAAIVLPSADIAQAADECLEGALSFNGQRCTAIKMIMVHESIAQEFLVEFNHRLSNWKSGMPWENDVRLTPLLSSDRPAYMQELVDDAVALGAKVVNVRKSETKGSYFSPAVLFPVNSHMRIYKEEQFGPVVPVMPFACVSTAVDWVSESDYGQQVSVFGRDPKMVGNLVDQLSNQVSRVNINARCQRGPDILPFTGRKDSAEGTLSVSDALRVFSIRSMAATKQTSDNEQLITEIINDRHSNFLSTDFIF
jgi:glyceraldehyde-3-phosphate dehydrogenase (NADP+)